MVQNKHRPSKKSEEKYDEKEYDKHLTCFFAFFHLRQGKIKGGGCFLCSRGVSRCDDEVIGK